MGFWRVVVAVLAALILAGCLPVTTTSPVGTAAGLGADKALIGAWKGRAPDDKKAEAFFVHFLPAKQNALKAVMLGPDDDEVMIFAVQTTKLGQNRYLNAVMLFDKEKLVEGHANYPLLYRIEGNTLRLFILDEAKVKAAIKAGKIKGTIAPGEGGDAVITAEPFAQDTFFAQPETVGLYRLMLVAKKVE